VWQSFVVLTIILLTFGIYAYEIDGLAYEYMMEGIDVVLICYLLWRVETLSDLSVTANDAEEETVVTDSVEDNDLPSSVSTNIAPLLKQHCEEAQLYLQYDITLSQLAKQIGTNRAYLSKHFALQGTTYNAYINGLRIRHFTNLYHKAVATHQIVTAQQLAYQSGFRSYNTFSVAFKKKMGMNTSEWMHNVAEQQRNPQ
jgi:AraC-like DNA-binding protein